MALQKKRPTPVVMLCDRKGPLRQPGSPTFSETAVYIAVVPDPEKFATERSLELHTDAVDALVDLMIELADNDGANGSGTPSQ